MARMNKNELRRMALEDGLKELQAGYSTLIHSGFSGDEYEKQKENLRFRMDKTESEIRKLDDGKLMDKVVDEMIYGAKPTPEDEELLSIIRGY